MIQWSTSSVKLYQLLLGSKKQTPATYKCLPIYCVSIFLYFFLSPGNSVLGLMPCLCNCQLSAGVLGSCFEVKRLIVVRSLAVKHIRRAYFSVTSVLFPTENMALKMEARTRKRAKKKAPGSLRTLLRSLTHLRMAFQLLLEKKVDSSLNTKCTNVIKIAHVYCFSSSDVFYFAVKGMHLQISLTTLSIELKSPCLIFLVPYTISLSFSLLLLYYTWN